MISNVLEAGYRAWRRYVVEGVPSSGVQDPEKDDIFEFIDALVEELERILEQATAGVVAGLEAVDAAQTDVLPSFTYSNGTGGVGATITGNANGALATSYFDNISSLSSARVFVSEQGAYNGIYDVTSVGDGSNPFVLTRATDADVASELGFCSFYVIGGDTLLGKSYQCQQSPSDITVGTTPLTFRLQSDTSSMAGAFAEMQEVLAPVDEGSFRVLDEEGFEIIKTDPDKGVGIGGAWFIGALTKLFSIRDEEGWSLMGLTRDKGLELPYCYLRPSTGGLLRVMDLEGFIYFQIDSNGLTQFIDGGSGGSNNDPGTVNYVMSGRVMTDGIDVMADLTASQNSQATLLIATDPFMTNTVYESAATMPMATDASANAKYRNARWRVTGLEPGTRYYYKVAVDGIFEEGDAATFKTFPDGVEEFSFWAGSCSRWTINENIESINYINENPGDDALFLVHLGDITYADIDANDIYRFRAELIRAMLNYDIGKQLGRTLPLMMIHDDHDGPGPNDAVWESVMGDGSQRPDALKSWRKAYRETALPYPFAQQSQGETDPDKLLLAQEWNVGTVRFLMPDCISQRTQVEPPTMLGTGTNPPGSWNQLQWLKDRLLASKADGVELIFLLMGPTWFTGGIPGSWGFWFTDERNELCDFLRDNDIPSVVLICGDGHRPIIDDGIATDYSTGGGAGFASILASAFLSGSNIGVGGSSRWLGELSLDGDSLQNAHKLSILVDSNGVVGWNCAIYTQPIDSSGNMTLLGNYSTNDAEREIQFTDTAIDSSAGGTLDIEVERTFLGIGSSTATWTSSNGGQSGTVTFNANQRLATITVNKPGSGSFTVTLSAPTGINTVIGDDNVTTVTIV